MDDGVKMNIAIVNECKTFGGAEVYVKNLKRILVENGHHVICMYLNANEPMDEDEYNLYFNTSMLSKYKYSICKVKKIRVVLEKHKIGLVIINNVFSEPLTLYKALYKYKTIQVMHDYSFVCPKSTCIKDDERVCDGYMNEKCMYSCSYHKSKLFLFLKLLLLNVLDVYRKRKCKFVAPNVRLTQYAMTNGYDVETLENPVILNVKLSKKKIRSGKYIYIGGLNKNKGLYDMLPAFDRFAVNRDVSLHIYGAFSSSEDEVYLKKFTSEKIIYHGYISHDEIENVFSEAYALLVPSFWMENYPTTVLEGFANRVLVIGSDRGGIPEMLADGRGICFEYGQNGLIKSLEYAESLSDTEYVKITDEGMKYLKERNEFNVYFKKLMSIIKKD